MRYFALSLAVIIFPIVNAEIRLRRGAYAISYSSGVSYTQPQTSYQQSYSSYPNSYYSQSSYYSNQYQQQPYQNSWRHSYTYPSVDYYQTPRVNYYSSQSDEQPRYTYSYNTWNNGYPSSYASNSNQNTYIVGANRTPTQEQTEQDSYVSNAARPSSYSRPAAAYRTDEPTVVEVKTSYSNPVLPDNSKLETERKVVSQTEVSPAVIGYENNE